MSLPAECVDEVGHLTQTLEVEQMRSRRKGSRGGGVVGGAEGDGSMAAIRQGDDNIRVLAVTDVDDGQLLSAEWVMGMGNGHESQRNVG